MATVKLTDATVDASPALLRACALIVCVPEGRAGIEYDHEVVPLAGEYVPPSTETCTFETVLESVDADVPEAVIA